MRYTEFGRPVNGNYLYCGDTRFTGICLRNIQNVSDLPLLSASWLLSSKVGLALLFLLLLPYSFITHALSTSTANTIEGTAPYLVLSSSDGTTRLTNLNELMGFSMPKRDGSDGTEWIDASMAGTALIAPTGMTFNDVNVLVTADGTERQLADVTEVAVGDDDGDALLATNTSIMGAMKATWYDGDIVLPASKLGDTLTSTSCDGGSYTLKVEVLTPASANTVYGSPNSTAYGTSDGVTYTFVQNNMKICYLKPLSAIVNKGIAGGNIKYANGYNATTWESNKGFKVEAGFPTTGFEKAVFSVIGWGSDQSKYRCSTDSPTKVSLSGEASLALGANCTVTYNSKTKTEFTTGGTPMIKMEFNRSTGATPDWVLIDSYSIPVPTEWAIGKGANTYGNTNYLNTSTKFTALDACRGVPLGTTTWAEAADQTSANQTWRQQLMFTRAELTNSPQADATAFPEGSAPQYSANYFSRDVDGTFLGEWGRINSYPGSGWEAGSNYWTAEAISTTGQFLVSSYGTVYGASPYVRTHVAMCRD